MIEDEELKGKLIKEAQTNWAKLDIYKRVCGGSEFSYYDGFIDCGLLKEKRIADLEQKLEIERSSRIALVNKIVELEETNERIASKYYELQETLKNANRAMVKELDDMTSGGVSVLENVVRSKEQLTKAKKNY